MRISILFEDSKMKGIDIDDEYRCLFNKDYVSCFINDATNLYFGFVLAFAAEFSNKPPQKRVKEIYFEGVGLVEDIMPLLKF